MTKVGRKLYLVIHKDKRGRPLYDLNITPTLASAKNVLAEPEKKNDKNKGTQRPITPDKDQNEPIFLKFTHDAGRDLEVLRSFNSLLHFVITASPLFQLMLTLEPALKDLARPIRGVA